VKYCEEVERSDSEEVCKLLVAVVLCLTLMPVWLVRAQEEPVLTVGDHSVPFLYRDGYYVASATVTPEVKKFTAGGELYPPTSRRFLL